MAKIVILGAGLTGLSSAYHLEQQGFFDYQIFEKEHSPGGLCRSVKHDGFIFDYTGHLLHVNNDYFKSFIHTIVGLENLNPIERKSFIYSCNTYTKYPFQINLYGLPSHVICECIIEFIKRKKHIKKPKNFHEQILKYFGRGIGKHFLLPQNKKVLQYDLKKVAPFWNGRFMPQTSLQQILDGAFTDKPELIGYNSHFLYPKAGGIEHLPIQLAKKLRNTVRLNSRACKIDSKKKRIVFEDGHQEQYEKLITTIPLDQLLNILNIPSNRTLKEAQVKLRCTSLVNFNLGIAQPNISEKHWIYFPEKSFPFYRIGFWHNFSRNMVKPGTSAIYGEFTYYFGTKTQTQLANLTKKSIKQVLNLIGLNHADIATEKILHLDRAYVIYDTWRAKHLPTLLSELLTFDIHSVGRFGAWKYSSMQEAILDGKSTADTMLKEKSFIVQSASKATISRSKHPSVPTPPPFASVHVINKDKTTKQEKG